MASDIPLSDAGVRIAEHRCTCRGCAGRTRRVGVSSADVVVLERRSPTSDLAPDVSEGEPLVRVGGDVTLEQPAEILDGSPYVGLAVA